MKWTQAKYPGDAVRQVSLLRNEEGGDIRIQHYGEKVRVASFLPGTISCPPGDTPKINPEYSEWFAVDSVADANALFDFFLRQAECEGWKVEREL